MEGQQPPVTVNAPITVTVNGAPGRRRRQGVERAMQDPIRTLLDQIKGGASPRGAFGTNSTSKSVNILCCDSILSGQNRPPSTASDTW